MIPRLETNIHPAVEGEQADGGLVFAGLKETWYVDALEKYRKI